jgi:putative Holliday junction resolvase
VARVLGCDYGTRRTGVAISDPGACIAFPLPTVEANTLAEAARRVAGLAAEREAAEIVVGMPLNSRGERGEQAGLTEKFVEALRSLFPGPVREWDERLTTAQSLRALAEMGEEPSARKGRVDQVAATLLLQSYLDSRRPQRDNPPETEDE